MKLFIWDLHGTLERGNEHAVVEMSNIILAEFGYRKRFTDEYVAALYGMKWYQYFEFLLPDEPEGRHLNLQAACFELSNSARGAAIIAKHMKPSQNAVLVLDAIHNRHDQVLISNTVPASVPVYIQSLGMSKYFTAANAFAVNLHNKEVKRSKTDVVKEFIDGKKYEELVVIGDSESDMLMARSVGAKAYLYAHPTSPFRGNLADVRIHDLKGLLVEL